MRFEWVYREPTLIALGGMLFLRSPCKLKYIEAARLWSLWDTAVQSRGQCQHVVSLRYMLYTPPRPDSVIRDKKKKKKKERTNSLGTPQPTVMSRRWHQSRPTQSRHTQPSVHPSRSARARYAILPHNCQEALRKTRHARGCNWAR